jgi:hypothetical protein
MHVSSSTEVGSAVPETYTCEVPHLWLGAFHESAIQLLHLFAFAAVWVGGW